MTPLSQKTRKNLFLSLFFVFLIALPFVLASSFGYKIRHLDDVFTLVRTGGIYLHSDINNVLIFMDGKYYDKRGVLIRNTLIQKLIPGNEHEIVVMKEGFHDWRKSLKIYPSIVTEARVLMLPIEIRKNEVYPFFDNLGKGTTTPPIESDIVVRYFNDKPIPTNKAYLDLVLMFEGEDIYIEKVEIEEKKNETSKKLIEIEDNLIKPIIPEYFTRFGVDDPENLENLIFSGGQVAWLDNGNVLINWMDENKNIPYYFCLEPDICRNSIILDWEKEILSFSFLPNRPDVLVVLISDGIYAVEIDDRSERNIQPIYLGEKLRFEINERNQIVVLDQDVFYELVI